MGLSKEQKIIESILIKEYNIKVVCDWKMKDNVDFLTTKEMSEIWRISLLCSQGRVESAIKKGKIVLFLKVQRSQ